VKAIFNWTTNRLFSYVHGNHLVYNTCWEDPRLDREVMGLKSDDDLVLITSAGCNALDYALDKPGSVHAVDLNFRQNALLELKIAGIRKLNFEEFFSLFGDGGHSNFRKWYAERLRSELSFKAQSYWDVRLPFFERPDPNASFYHRGTTGAFGKMLVAYCKMAGVYEDALSLFSASSIDEQRKIYFEKVKPRFWGSGIKRALGTDLAMSLIGVPKAQRDHLEATCAKSVSDFMEDCMESVFTELSTADNYFWRLYLFGRYSKECCPEYLKRHNFELLKGGLVEKVHVATSDLTSFLRMHPKRFSKFVLLDHMDWLSTQSSELLEAEWQAIFDRARPGAMALWRSGGSFVDYVDPLTVQKGGQTRRVGDLLEYDTASASACHARDRVHTYGSFYIARLNN
jgi:S-adenosylmethionine-diacylglycerol 3-amino-3-carboxypropyl transferase